MHQVIRRWLAKILRIKSPAEEFMKMFYEDIEEEEK